MHFAEKYPPSIQKPRQLSFLDTSDEDIDDLIEDPLANKNSGSVTKNSNNLVSFLSNEPVENISVVSDRYEIVCYDSSEVMKIACSSDDDVIYVYGGHGRLGCTTIETQDQNKNKYELEASEVATRVIRQFGLDISFKGKIKLYVCNSTATEEGQFPHTFGGAFVKTFTSTCKNCKIYAYAAMVEKRHETNIMSEGKMRKGGSMDGKFSLNPKRASSFRWELYPSFTKSKK